LEKQAANIKKTAISALFTAVIAVVSQISFMTPLGVPVTFQTFAIALCGYVLGIRAGLASTAVYIFLGAVGLPVFSGFRGGFQHIFGATGGFIFGFLLLTLMCSLGSRYEKKYIKLFCGFVGLILCHIVGVLQFAFVTSGGILEAFVAASLPFVIKDAILIFVAAFISDRIVILKFV